MADSVKDLHAVVVGAGMAGLACALSLARKGFKRVSVYERASDLGFVGAGIQLAPNLARVLDRLNCWDEIRDEATNIKMSRIMEGATGKELSFVEMPDIEEKYGYPHCTGHRAGLAGGLFKACQAESAITFNFSCELVSIDSFGLDGSDEGVKITVRKLKPEPGPPEQVSCDMLLGADGIKSVVRTALMRATGSDAEVEDTGQAAYRIMLTRDQMKHDPEMLELIDSDCSRRWIGERRHIIAYPISNKTIYNLSTCQPDVNFAETPSATYTTRGSKEAMLRVYGDFCPLVHRMLDLVPEGEVCEWKLRAHKALDTWTLGGVALLGDACHPTLPHLNQGAAMAIEDGATVAEVLAELAKKTSKASSAASKKELQAEVARTLKVYELLRKDRTSTLVDLAAFSGRTLHLGEGKAKEERDRMFAESNKKGKPVPDKWASPEVQKMIYSYDCVKEAQDQFGELLAKL